MSPIVLLRSNGGLEVKLTLQKRERDEYIRLSS